MVVEPDHNVLPPLEGLIIHKLTGKTETIAPHTAQAALSTVARSHLVLNIKKPESGEPLSG
jgi:hypothetical protein